MAYPASSYPHPPQYEYNQPPQQQPVILEQPVQVVISAPPQVGPDPTMLTCPSCRSNVLTRMEFEATTRTHIAAALLCIFGCWPCVCIPYCVDSCQNGNHYCPNCGSYIGTYTS